MIATSLARFRELLDHVVVLNEDHLGRLLGEFLECIRWPLAEAYHPAQVIKGPPCQGAVCASPSATARVASVPRLGGLHHRYEWREAG